MKQGPQLVYFLPGVFNRIQLAFISFCLPIPHIIFNLFSILFYFYSRCTMFLLSSAMCDVVEVPAVSDDEHSVISEDDLAAIHDIL